MITLKDLNTLINHLHQANLIFETEATIEERKHKEIEKKILNDKRTEHAPRSFVLHHKAEMVETIEKKLLTECEKATVTLEESTIYSARELIAESMYPWINRKEPPTQYMDELIADETFIPFAYKLEEKKKIILESGIHSLLLPEEARKEIITFFEYKKSKTEKYLTITVGDIFLFPKEKYSEFFINNTEYKTKLLLFRLYTTGLLEKDRIT